MNNSLFCSTIIKKKEKQICDMMNILKSKPEVFEVAHHQIFYATNVGLLLTSEMSQIRYVLKSGDFCQNLRSLDMITLS